MSIEIILKNAMLMLNSCHVLGAEAETFASAKQNIQACIETLSKVRKEAEEHADTDDQGR